MSSWGDDKYDRMDAIGAGRSIPDHADSSQFESPSAYFEYEFYRKKRQENLDEPSSPSVFGDLLFFAAEVIVALCILSYKMIVLANTKINENFDKKDRWKVKSAAVLLPIGVFFAASPLHDLYSKYIKQPIEARRIEAQQKAEAEQLVIIAKEKKEKAEKEARLRVIETNKNEKLALAESNPLDTETGKMGLRAAIQLMKAKKTAHHVIVSFNDLGHTAPFSTAVLVPPFSQLSQQSSLLVCVNHNVAKGDEVIPKIDCDYIPFSLARLEFTQKIPFLHGSEKDDGRSIDAHMVSRLSFDDQKRVKYYYPSWGGGKFY